MATVHFPEVKAVLDGIIATWTAGNGAPPNFASPTNHGGPFTWSTPAELLVSSARGLPMIQPAIIGQAGMGQTANIVLALTVGAPKPGGGNFPQMPDGGLDSNTGVFLTLASPEIQTIINWIEGGCLP
jgi:hypothetical protein